MLVNCIVLETSAVLRRARYIDSELHIILFSIGMLLPLPGESVETSALELGATSKTVGSSMAQLLTAANQGQSVK